MMNDDLYNVRMSASKGGRHISGAERIVAADKIDVVLRDLTARAMLRGAEPDQIRLAVESLKGHPLRMLTALDVVTVDVPDAQSGRSMAIRVLQRMGIADNAANSAVNYLASGAAMSGGNMRGAIIMDALDAERLEPDRERGVRASRFDWSEDASRRINDNLAAVGLTHFRTREALALATKVAHAPGMVAELCWSDEPDYTAGYVASLKTGYVRFPFLKEKGDTKGGRVFFVDRGSLDLNALTRYLQTEAVLIVEIGECKPSMKSDDYFDKFKQITSFPNASIGNPEIL
ncbi:MAG: 6-carboxyhexanoate--CoA ligase [Betaproteobacteria bacterium]